ncbi:MAG: hypothetical protein R3F56_25570 [Planctomycetota bacterium]
MVLLAALLSVLSPPQDPAPAARFALDGKDLTEAAAVVSPLGWLEVKGEPEAGETRLVKLRFPMLAWPTPGEHDVSGDAVSAYVGTVGREGDAVSGKLEVGEIGPARVRFHLRFERDGAEHDADIDLPAALYVPKMQPKVTDFTPPREEPDLEDVVVCVLGNGGTGLPGQKMVAESMAKLAPQGPLDAVILLGNNILPRGVRSERDPLFQERFEQVYDVRRLNVPFYVLQGPADHEGDVGAAEKYGFLNARWTSPAHGIKVELPCHGKTVGLYGCDSTFQAGEVADLRVRSALRMVAYYAMNSKADWKIMFSYHQPIWLGGKRDGDSAKLERLTDRVQKHLVDGKFDLLVSAEGRGLRFVQPKDGIPQVMAGGGGGPEMAAVVAQVPGTEFAYGGGGTVWLRFSGDKLTISFRDAAGELLYARELTKP